MNLNARDIPLPYTGRTYSITDDQWIGGPALRSFDRITDDWALDARQRATVLGVDGLDLIEWTAQAWNGEFPRLPEVAQVALTNVLVLRRELTARFGPEGQAEWLRAPYDDALFQWPRHPWYQPDIPAQATPLETMLLDEPGGVRWVREIFHPREPLGAYACPDLEMLFSEKHDWLPALGQDLRVAGPALRSYHRVIRDWGLNTGNYHDNRILAARAGFLVRVNRAELTKISHILALRKELTELLGPSVDQRAWIRERQPCIFDAQETPLWLINMLGVNFMRVHVRKALGVPTQDPPFMPGPDYELLADEDADWLKPHYG
ncbi:hypothetical protein [Paracoccus sanguinis]|uniref:Uncharacterized protein n=1 Tax=Paracoccus sanguinis TaxID=1545044 RepID=A0A099GLQ4_9RHOB|nr:hypothetical protein [Paracoccus sanguinis]KGJ23774.1 hypothetical protein IX56_00425 [Paracoccus sanguinis]